MAIQHATISDADRHEAKGADSAAAGTVCTANGDGTTSFENVSYDDLVDVPSVVGTNLSGFSLASTQTPTAVDTPLQITFGSGSSTEDAVLDSSGNISFTYGGTYLVNFNGVLGRTTATGESILIIRTLINGAQVGQSFGGQLDSMTNLVPISNIQLLAVTAGQVLTFEIVQDSAGIANGGLYKISGTMSGLNDIPSALVTLTPFAGS